MNLVAFMKMAHGDARGLKELAIDYFSDTRRRMKSWRPMLAGGNFNDLRDDLHRCKGGASLFGLDRLVALIGACERPGALERTGFDLALFEEELSAAEQAVNEVNVPDP